MFLIKLSFLDKCCFCFFMLILLNVILIGSLVKIGMVIKNSYEERRCQKHVVSLASALKYTVVPKGNTQIYQPHYLNCIFSFYEVGQKVE